MSLAVGSSPGNQNRPLLQPSPLPSDRRSSTSREGRMRTLLDLLTIEKMDGGLDRTTVVIRSNGAGSRWRILKQRLGLRVVGCCGVSTWRYTTSSQDSVIDDRNDVAGEVNTTETRRVRGDEATDGMDLATAIAAERELRGEEGGVGVVETPSRVSLMRLLEETTDGGYLGGEMAAEEVEVEVGSGESVCCVCMGRKKGAALIPCGHTYCRVCSKGLWINRGFCPLCNRRILDILDIF